MTASCFSCSFRQRCYVGSVDENGEIEFSAAVHRYTVRRKGTAIFNQGEPADCCYFLCEGLVKVSHTSVRGDEVILDVAAAPALLGKGEILQRSVHFASVMSITETVEIAHIKTEILIDLLKDYPAAMQSLLIHLRQQTDKAHKSLACMTLRVRDRLLSMIALNFPTEGDNPFTVPLSNIELAQLTQTSPETISRTLYQLQAAGRVSWDSRRVLTIKPSILREYLERIS